MIAIPVPMHGTALFLAMTLAGCSSRPTPAHARPPPALEHLERLIPDGAEWQVLSRPAELWRSAAVRVALEPAATARDLAAFADRTGADLTKLSHLVAGGFGIRGDLVALRGTDARKKMRRVLLQMTQPSWAIQPLDREVVLVGIGPGSADLLGAARQRVARPAPPVLPVERLRSALPDAPFQLLYLVPLQPDRSTPAAVLLSGVRAAGVAVSPRGAEILVNAVLEGDFPATAETNFRAMLESIALSSLGRVFDLLSSLESLEIRATAERVTLQIALPAQNVADGIRTLFVAQIQELLEFPAPNRPNTPTPSPRP